MNATIRRQRLTIDAVGVAACVAVLAAAYLLGFAPLMGRNAGAVARHRELAAQRGKATAAVANVRQLKARVAALVREREQDTFRPAPLDRTNARLREITSLAANRGLEVKGVEPGAAREQSPYQVVPLRLTGSGNFRGCVDFLRDLRGALRDTTVVGFRFSATPQVGGSPVTFELDLCWYAAAAVARAED